MSARILAIDDVAANLRLIEAMLGQDYYQVVSASRGEEGLAKALRNPPDVILLDVVMPGLDGFETCRRLRAETETAHIPIIMLTALDGTEDRVRGLEAGADDFVSKPFDSVQLLARVRSFVRFKTVLDELRAREASGRRLGAIEASLTLVAKPGAIVVIDPDQRQQDKIISALRGVHQVAPLSPAEIESSHVDLVVVSTRADDTEGLRLVARLQAGEATRTIPVLAVCSPDDPTKAAKALDLGAQDIIWGPVDPDELRARVASILKRRRLTEALRRSLDKSHELVVTDPLTGLFNRRYLHSQLPALVERAVRGGPPVALLVADIDYFKRVNDTYGHDAGDAVIKEFAVRIASNLRPSDIAFRIGGEEFVVVMPGVTREYATIVSERLRRTVSSAPFSIGEAGDPIDVTVSIGLAAASAGAVDSAEGVLKRADDALYKAKQDGRNRVVVAA